MIYPIREGKQNNQQKRFSAKPKQIAYFYINLTIVLIIYLLLVL